VSTDQLDRGAGVTGGSRARDATLERVAAVVERARPVIRVISPPTLALIALGVIATAVIGHAAWVRLDPLDLDDTVMLALLLAALLLPAILLTLFWLALQAVRELPEKIRTFPETAGRHRTTLGEVARGARERPASGRGWFRNLWRMAKLVYNAREDLLLYLPLVELFNPVMLLGAALAVPAILLEALIAAAILVSRVA
jgi:hypothetical protein